MTCLHAYLEVAGMRRKEGADKVEVEDALEKPDVILSRVDDLDLKRTKRRLADLAQINSRRLEDLVRLDRLGLLEDLLRNAFGRRATVLDVVLDTEVFGRTYKTRIQEVSASS